MIAIGIIIMMCTFVSVGLMIYKLLKGQNAVLYIVGIPFCVIVGGVIMGIGFKNQPHSVDVAENTEVVTEESTTEITTTEITTKETTTEITTEKETTEVTTEEETEEITTEDPTEIDGLEYQAYWDMAKEIVKSCMKNPDSADFPSSVFGGGDIAMAKNGHLVVVQSYVVGTNSFGASIKTNFEVEFLAYDTENFIYDLVYMKLGDDVVGEYVNINEWKE